MAIGAHSVSMWATAAFAIYSSPSGRTAAHDDERVTRAIAHAPGFARYGQAPSPGSARRTPPAARAPGDAVSPYTRPSAGAFRGNRRGVRALPDVRAPHAPPAVFSVCAPGGRWRAAAAFASLGAGAAP
ncbi:hypothetical protein PHLGIDRAFT_119674 [Phlebiopsis gigantea 11061_1 CR5-6]|uniref:Uncharacterized protein n=1 Tax=Phlebiopsis gigantea (strain 11061_1 CR5-6) TaxID=745531 RepID=A0A0C3NKU7_PHLG1|nr:hypothetical protein PHLGIDRAFT_119674 [Phlebiopsis gigantea 11061_1 CR5-6]